MELTGVPYIPESRCTAHLQWHPMPCRAVLRQPSPFYSASGAGLMTAGSSKHIFAAHAYLKCWPEIFRIFYLVLLFLWFSLKTQLPSTESSFELPSQWSVTFEDSLLRGTNTPGAPWVPKGAPVREKPRERSGHGRSLQTLLHFPLQESLVSRRIPRGSHFTTLSNKESEGDKLEAVGAA